MTEHLVPEYHRARLVVVLCAALVLLRWLGIPFEGTIPLINVKLPDDARLPYVLACLLAYGLLRLIIEWAQSEPERRRRRASKIDLTLSLSIGGAAAWALATRILPPFEFPAVPLLPALAVIVLGIASGELLNTWLLNLLLIRSKEEARRLALPRIPVAVRASFRMGYVVLPALSLFLLLTPSLSPPMSSLWPWLLSTPMVLLLLSGTGALVSRRHTKPDGTVVSRSEFIRGLRAVFDRHDAHYQIGGWDRPMAPSNSPLYQAAERGDSAVLAELLRGGADPDEANMHGWTPLMIAVAQQHVGTSRLLLESGADPNRSNLLGRNALMFAARYGHEELVRQLLEHGARPDMNESNDPGALSAAAANGHAGVVRLLLDAGADPARRDEHGKSAHEYATQAGHGELAALIRRARRDASTPPA